MIVLLFAAGAFGAAHVPVSGQSSSCTAMPAGADAALIGGEVGVYAFDDAQRSTTGSYTPLHGSLGTIAAPSTGSSQTVLNYGESFRLDGAEGFTMPADFQTALDAPALTWWITFSVDDIGEKQYLIDGSPTASSDGGMSLWMQEGGRMWIQWRDDARTDVFAQVHDFTVKPCKSHTIMVTTDAATSRSKVWLDGRLLNDLTSSEPDMGSATQATLASDRAANHPWKGKIDALHIYDRALPVIEHLAVMEGPYCEEACTDSYPPAVRTLLSGTRHAPGYYRSPVTLEIEGADAGIGLAGIWSDAADGTNFTQGTGPYEFPDDGNYTVTYNATDHNSNEAGPKSTSFTVDTEPPIAFWDAPLSGNLYVAGEDFAVAGDNTVIAGSPTFTFEVNGVDTTSEVVSVALYRNGNYIALDNERPFTFEVTRPIIPLVYEYEARAVDHAGNYAIITQDVLWV